MNLPDIQPPQVDWASGAFADGPLLSKSTRLRDLAGIFADEPARQQLPGEQVIYDVEMLATSPAEGELYTGVTHLYPGRVGGEYFMTRGHFHARREQGEVYFGLRGNGLLLLQNEQGEARLEKVFTGSVHIIPGFTAHRLINTGGEVLSALAVWPGVAGHDYAALANGFALRVMVSSEGWEVHHD
ncbi:glucose-6-phosphate isomerase family protein [Pseudocitrobacter cyperus]|uniref:glucose-6-phosphate isomerase n=1 Tax=Pseudocitrobacter cyperus TaxID=3112843 RepID=A0ABV0HI20_9ENTR